MHIPDNYKTIRIRFNTYGILKEFKTSERLVKKCFKNGHYSRGILAAALCEKLNRTEDPTYEVFGDGETYYDVDYEELGEKIFLEKKNLGKCSFYDLKLDEEHYEEPFDGKNIFAEVLTDFFVIKVCFHVPYWFVTQ